MKTPALLLSAAAVLCASGNLFAEQAPAAPNVSDSATSSSSAAAAPTSSSAAASASATATSTTTVTTSTTVTTTAPAPALRPSRFIPPPPERKPYSLDIAAGAQAVSFRDKATQDVFLYGGSLSLSGYLSKSRPFLKNMLLTADVGFFAGDYTDTMSWSRGPYTPHDGPPSDHLLQTNVLSRKNTQYSIPVHLTLAYEIPAKDFRFRIGPTLGFTFVSIKSNFDAYHTISNPNDPADPNSNGYVPDGNSKQSASQAVFSYGGTAGATWNITDRLHVDIQYRLVSGGALDFGEFRNFGKTLSHQFNLGFGWRF